MNVVDAVVFVVVVIAHDALLLALVAAWTLLVDRRAARSRTCSCGHVRSVHDLDRDKCDDDVVRRHYDANGRESGHEYVECACHGYDGPGAAKPVDWSQLLHAPTTETPREEP